MVFKWRARPEVEADISAVRRVVREAFPTPFEADLVDALRTSDAWVDGLSMLATDSNDLVVGHALLTRCHVGDSPALALAPCAVLPEHQRQGAGTAAIRAVIAAARERDESLIIVLGHAGYYSRFGFRPASRFGIKPPFEVAEAHFMALVLNDNAVVPKGTVRYPAAFGV